MRYCLSYFVLLVLSLAAASLVQADVGEVRVIDDRWQLELIAEQPDIVTPIGIACDSLGRLLVVESHTHKRPEDYEGPPADRIRMLADSDGDGRLDQWSTFHEGLRYSMNLVIHESSVESSVYVVSRNSIVRLRDNDGDGRAEESTEIIRLECEENKAHSALVGLSFTSDGTNDKTMVFGLGKNTGKPYRVVGSDGTEFTGEGDGGSIFRCRPDGSQLERIATGLWNPWGICVDPQGRIFCTENDPDSSPPCQLLHIVPGGDYGFQTQFGRDGRNPLQSRNGQLPGTLEMVCGIGESPCDVKPFRGALWIASWVDHTIRNYRLVPEGASFRATRETVVQGNTDFRPVGLAPAPDGSLYVSDWVDRSYPIHGKGRIWRLSLREASLRDPSPREPTDQFPKLPALSEAEQRAERLRSSPELSALSSSDPFLRQAAIFGFSQQDTLAEFDWRKLTGAKQRLGILEALRWRKEIPSADLLHIALNDPNKDVRLFTTRWIAENRLREHRDAIQRLLSRPDIHSREYLVYLSAADWLDRGELPARGHVAEQLLARELESGKRPPSAQALILRLLPPDHEYLTLARLEKLTRSADAGVRLEAVRTLSSQNSPSRFKTLANIARNNRFDQAMRLEAIVGLSSVLTGAVGEHHPLLKTLAKDKNEAIGREATRALRLGGILTVKKKHKPPAEDAKPPAEDIDAWLQLVEQSGDAESGRRLFFSPVGPLCSRCHQFDGRGGTLAPDLTLIGKQQSRRRILTSILQPSNEIDMRYTPWILFTDEGIVHTGLAANSPGDDGTERYYNSAGELFTLPSDTIESREPSQTSIMPSGLDKLISIDDLRDLIALLTENGGAGEGKEGAAQ